MTEQGADLDPLGRAPMLEARLLNNGLQGWRVQPVGGAEKARVLERIRQAGMAAEGRRAVLIAVRMEGEGDDLEAVRRCCDETCHGVVPGFPKAVALDTETLAWSFLLPPTDEERMDLATRDLQVGRPAVTEVPLPRWLGRACAEEDGVVEGGTADRYVMGFRVGSQLEEAFVRRLEACGTARVLDLGCCSGGSTLGVADALDLIAMAPLKLVVDGVDSDSDALARFDELLRRRDESICETLFVREISLDRRIPTEGLAASFPGRDYDLILCSTLNDDALAASLLPTVDYAFLLRQAQTCLASGGQLLLLSPATAETSLRQACVQTGATLVEIEPLDVDVAGSFAPKEVAEKKIFLRAGWKS